jgi:hypothetical protein
MSRIALILDVLDNVARFQTGFLGIRPLVTETT